MPKGQSEVEKFFEGLPSEDKKEADIFEDIKKEDPPAKEEPKADDPEKEGEPRKNRRHRRLEEQLQREREARIAAEARAGALAEMPHRSESEGEVPSEWLRIYGDTPESRTAWKLNKGIFEGIAEKAKKDAIAEIESKRAEEVRKAKEFESFIDSELEGIEDEFNVDVTSDAPAARKARRELLELVESLSPKDKDGNLAGYADFQETWKLYQAQRKEQKPDASKNKELAARTVEKSSDSQPVEKKRTPGFFGWQKDLEING